MLRRVILFFSNVRFLLFHNLILHRKLTKNYKLTFKKLITMEVVEKKEMVHTDVYDHKEYASKGVAGTGLGLIF